MLLSCWCDRPGFPAEVTQLSFPSYDSVIKFLDDWVKRGFYVEDTDKIFKIHTWHSVGRITLEK